MTHQYMEIKIEELENRIKALEQELKSEWQHNHEVLKAYSDDANEVLNKIRSEIVELRSRQNVGVLECLDIIDRYKAEGNSEK